MSSTTDTAPDPLQTLLAQAMQCHTSGRATDAERLYGEVLSQDSQHPDALHLLGLLAAQAHHLERAQGLIWQAIAVQPGEAMFHNNLANVCIQRGQLAEAEALYVRALELDGRRLDALSNLGLLLSRTDRPDAAEQLLLRAVELAPNNPDWRQNLANLYLSLGRQNDALAQCHDGLVVAPRSRALRGLMVLAYAHLGLKAKAIEVLRAWIASEPDDPYPQHHLAALTGEQVPQRASDDYVSRLFDGFAGSFDAKLADLSYQAPQLVAAEVARRAGPAAQDMDVLDAGCGTGLCGPLLAPFARQLVGVDLSEGMLRLAFGRSCYDSLIQGELVAFLRSTPAAYDLLTSADTLCYFGALEGFAEVARTALRAGGWLVFTVEAHPSDAGLPDHALQRHGRYSHSQPYVECALRSAGLHPVETQAVVLRHEGGQPVPGWLVTAQAPALPLRSAHHETPCR